MRPFKPRLQEKSTTGRKNYLSNEQYVSLAREWRKWDDRASKRKTRPAKMKAIRKRNAVAEDILKSLHYLIHKQVARYTLGWDRMREDCFSAAQAIIVNKALRKWDEEKAAEYGKTFVGYVSMWILNACQRTVDKYHLPVRVPVNKRTKVRGHIARGEDIPEELRDCDPTFLDVDMPLENNANLSLGDVLLVEPPSQDKTHFNRFYLERLMEVLHPNEKEIFLRVSGNGDTLKEIGDEWGLSRERIRQMHAAAIKKMHNRAQVLDYAKERAEFRQQKRG